MKKFGSVFVLVFAIFFCSCFFSACDESTLVANFKQSKITLEMNKEYDPYSFIKENIDQSTRKSVTFKFANNSVAYVNPEQKIVATGYGVTTLYALYNNKEIASVNVNVPRPKVQLLTPVNLHYDIQQGALVWNYVYYELNGAVQLLKNYCLEITNNNKPAQTVEIKDQNFYSFNDIGTYSVKVKSVAPTEGYISSDFCDEYTFCVMAKPLNLKYVDATKTLTWDTNSNPEGTKYKVVYTLDGQAEKNAEVTTNQFVVPEDVAKGKHTFKVTTVPKDETYFQNQSDVLKIQKIATPTLTFNNGVFSWGADELASSYIVQVWKYSQNQWINTGYNETITETGEKTITLNIATKNVCKEEGQYKLSVKAVGDENHLIYNSEESNQYAFTKLPLPVVEYKTASKTFEITNANLGVGKLTLKKKSTSEIYEGTSTLRFNAQDYGEYSIEAQLLPQNSQSEIASEIVKVFSVGETDNLTTIQNLPNTSLSYYELDGQSFVKYLPNTNACNYELLKDNEPSTLEATNNEYSLGVTADLFTSAITEHKYRLNVTKQPLNNVFFVDNYCEINVKQLSAPTKLTLKGDEVEVVGELDNKINSIEYKISANEGNFIGTTHLSLDNADKWEIKARFIATDALIDNVYYSSSPFATFKIEKLQTPQNLKFNYITKTFSFNVVRNASSYNVYQQDELLKNITTNKVELPNLVGGETVVVEAIPKDWQPIAVNKTGYLTSGKSSCYIYKVADIEDLALESNNDIVTARWSAPVQNFDDGTTKVVRYSLSVTGENTNVLIPNITKTNYTFASDLFNSVGDYTIKVQVTSLNNDFYPTTTSKSVTLTKLTAPQKLTRKSNTLSVKDFDESVMSGIKVQFFDGDNPVGTIDSDVNIFDFAVEDGKVLTVKVATKGRFEQNSYYLTSPYSVFYVQRLGTVENLIFKGFGVSSDNFKFVWDSYEKVNFGKEPSSVCYKYYVEEVGDSEKPKDVTTIDRKEVECTNRTKNELIFHVQEFSSDDKDLDISQNGVLVLSSLSDNTVRVYKENTVDNVEVEVTDEDVIVTWNYTPRFEFDGTYNPKFYVSLTDTTGKEEPDGYKEILGYSKNANGKYERKYKILDKFVNSGDYVFKIYVRGSKTIDSSYKNLTITKLQKIENLTINGNDGIFSYIDNKPLTLIENSCLVFDNANITENYNKLTLDKVDFTKISSSTQDTEFTVYHKAPTPSETVQIGTKTQYYINSDVTKFCVIRLPQKAVSYNESINKLVWEDVISPVIKDYASYTLFIKSEAIGQFSRSNLTSNSLDMESTLLTNPVIEAGKAYVQVKTIVNTRTIGVYDDTESTKGYLSSDYGQALEVEKLQPPTDLKLTVNSDNNQKLTLSWADPNPQASEKYNVYIYKQGAERGNPKQYEADLITQDGILFEITLDRALFEEGTTLVEIEAVAKQKITSNLSKTLTCVKLDAVPTMTVDGESIVSWVNTNQIKQNSKIAGSYVGFLIEVLDNGGTVKFSNIITKESIETDGFNYKLLSYIGENDDFLPNLEGEFAVRISVIGSDETANDIITLTSQPYKITAKKLKAPTIDIKNNCVVVSSTEDNVQCYVTIKNNASILFSELYTNPIELDPNTYSNFEVTAYAKSTLGNILNSKISEKTVSKLQAPTGLNVEVSDSNLAQKNVTLFWNSVENATSYNIYVNNNEPISTSLLTYNFVDAFNDAGTYTIRVQATMESDMFYSDLSTALNVIRLNPMENAYVETDGIVHFGSPYQSSDKYTIYTYLQNTELKSSTTLPKTTETYNGYQNYLNDLEGGRFIVKIQYIGSGVTDLNNVCTLSSAESTVVGYKFYAPVIKITPDRANISVNQINVNDYNQFAQNTLTVMFNGDYAKKQNGTKIDGVLTNEFVYPDIWEAGVYTFIAQTIPNDTKNIIPSKLSTQNTTRLDAPTDLSFSRINDDTQTYFTDEDEVLTQKIGSQLQFNFVGVQNAKEYKLSNGKSYYGNAISQVGTSDLKSQILKDGFEEFVYSGNNQIKIISVANVGGEFINSKSTTLRFKTLSPIAEKDFYTDGTYVIWSTPETDMQGVLIRGNQNAQTKYWQTTDPNKFKSKLTDLQYEGDISLNIKLIGNVTETPISEDVILDSMYICNENLEIINQTFTKLSQIQSLATNKGYFVFEIISKATSYTAYFSDGVGEPQEFALQNYQQRVGFDKKEHYLGFNDNISSKLDPAKTYSVYVIAKSSNNRILFSDPSNTISAKVLKDANSEIQLELEKNGEDLTKKVVKVNLDPNASGVWIYENGEYLAPPEYDADAHKYYYYPKVLTSGTKTIKFASLGSTLGSTESIHYLTSSYTTFSIDTLEQVTVNIKDGKFVWEAVDGADGYYVYVNTSDDPNDNLYGNGIYQKRELSLDEVCRDDANVPIKLKIVPVCVENEKLWGPESYYELVQTIGQDTKHNQTFAIKLHKPKGLDVNNGMLLWASGVERLDYYDHDALMELLNDISSNPSISNVDELDDYIELLFTMPITTYSKYTGFNDLKIMLTLTDESGQNHQITTDAYKFLTLTQDQKDNLDDLCTTLKTEIDKILKKLTSTSTTLYTLEKQTFSSEKQFIYARLSLIKQHFSQNNTYLKQLLNCANNQGTWPTYNLLFNEFEGEKTATLQSGLYTVNITQFGNNFDWLNSTKSDNQKVFVPKPPKNLQIVASENDFFLEFDKVVIDSSCYYPGNLDYVLIGENNEGKRFFLSNDDFEYSGKVRFNLTSLVENDILTPQISKLFVYVAGYTNSTNEDCKTAGKYQVISGLKSNAINITVLPQLKPWFTDGELVLAEEMSKFGFEIKAYKNDLLFGSEVIQTTNWIGEDSYILKSGENYNIAVRNIGQSGITADNAVLSGKSFKFNAEKLATPIVSINKRGQFEWANNVNSKGYILYIDDVEYLLKQEEGQTLYESDVTGYKNYKFRLLGTTSGLIQENGSGYYINSMIHNSHDNSSGSGYDAVMLSKVSEIFVEEGLLKWKPANKTSWQNLPKLTDGQTLSDNYKIIIDDNLVFYTSDLVNNDIYSIDNQGNRCIDLTDQDVGYGTHTVTIQPYFYVIENEDWKNSKTVYNQLGQKEYYQILGAKCESTFNKIMQPYDIEVVNGEIVWKGNVDDLRYDYQIFAGDKLVDSGPVTEAKMWPAELVKPDGTQYIFKVRAYQENGVFSNYSTMSSNLGEVLTFEKTEFDLPNIMYVPEESGNYITFSVNKSGNDYGLNITYAVNEAKNFKTLKCYDEQYARVVTKTDSESIITFKIKVDELGNNIEHLYYYLQLVCLGSTSYDVASNFTSQLDFSIPRALEKVFFDETTFEYFFEAQTTKTGYIIKDEILDKNNLLVATYFYTIEEQEFEDIEKQNYFKVRTVDEKTMNTISFSPVVMGYKHRVSVATISTGVQKNIAQKSNYRTCEYISETSLFKAEKDIFDASTGIYNIVTEIEFTNYLKSNIYGTEDNAFLIENAEDFAKLNLRLDKYNYLSSFKVDVANTSFGEISIDDKNSNLYFKQTKDIDNVDFVIGVRANSGLGVQYAGFNNTYDGQNNKITYALTPTDLSDKFGLFRIVEKDGVIKNLAIDGTINYNTVQYLGGLTAENEGVIENIVIKDLKVNNFKITPSSVSAFEFGGVVAENSGTITNVQNNSETNLIVVTIANNIEINVGGLVAKNNLDAIIKQSGNKMNISVTGPSTIFAGGVVAKNFGHILQSYNATQQISAVSSVVSLKVYVGGVVGYNDKNGDIDSVYALGSVSSSVASVVYNVYAGGLVGFTDNKNIKNSYSGVGEIILKNDDSTVYGGTLIGKVNTTEFTENKNFYVKDTHAFGSDTTSYGDFATEVDITRVGAINELAENLNQLTNGEVYTIINGNIAFVWERVE